jgi:hypothetical protein
VADKAYALFFDSRQRVLLARLGRSFTPEAIERMQAAVRRFVAANGLCRAIADLSAVEEVDMPSRYMVELGRQRAILFGERRVLVAPRPDVFGLARMFGMNQAATGDEPLVVRRLEEAYAALGIRDPDFRPVAPE